MSLEATAPRIKRRVPKVVPGGATSNTQFVAPRNKVPSDDNELTTSPLDQFGEMGVIGDATIQVGGQTYTANEIARFDYGPKPQKLRPVSNLRHFLVRPELGTCSTRRKEFFLDAMMTGQRPSGLAVIWRLCCLDLDQRDVDPVQVT